jgi:hypothetical protein
MIIGEIVSEKFTEEVLVFIKSFVEDEFDLWKKVYTQRDETIFLNDQLAFSNNYFLDMETDARRRQNPDEKWFEVAKESLSAIQKRKIFQIKFFNREKYKQLAAAYLSSIHVGGDSYFELIIIAEIDTKLKIITSCLTDHEGYFDYNDGIEFEELPKPVKILKLNSPSNSADLKEYNED